MAKLSTKTLTLSSTFEELHKLEPFIEELQASLHFNDETYGNIMLALSEAVTNAIVHGNEQDASKKVFIEAKSAGDRLEFSVRDEGEGFDPSDLPNPLEDDNLLKEGGRGVYLIKQYADRVNYSEGGSKLTIEFEID